MILTITANPSVDISYNLDRLLLDDVNRTSSVKKDAGGKGIHVSFVLNELGEDVINSGFVGGKLGEFIEKRLDERSIKHEFVKLDGDTRNCIAIIHENKQTEILEQGPEVLKKNEEKFLSYLKAKAKDLDIINISGSLPRGLDVNFYKKIVKFAKDNKIFISVDTSGKTLKDLVSYEIKPDLIKPNEKEIVDIIGEEFPKDEKKIREVFEKSSLRDIAYVLVSQGKNGAIVRVRERIYKAAVPKIKAINPVGSGDSTVAGALSSILKKESDESFIKKSMTCGLLNALEEEIAHINMKDFDKYYEKIKVKELR